MLVAPGIRLKRVERKDHIIHEMQRSSSVYQSVKTISELIGTKPSTHLRDMLNELVEEGRLHSHKIYKNAIDGWTNQQPLQVLYCLPSRDPRDPRVNGKMK